MRKIFVILIGLFFAGNVFARPTMDILSDADADVYQQIFMLQDK